MIFSIMLWVAKDNTDFSQNRIKLLLLKVQVFAFELPYYLFFLVTTSLLFSANSFYKSLRNILFPDIRMADKQASDEKFR